MDTNKKIPGISSIRTIEQRRIINYLMMASLFSINLVAIRIMMTGSIGYLFMIWNLFLAWIPFMLSDLIYRLEQKKYSGRVSLILFLAWVLFFPNSPYLITDLFHLSGSHGPEHWYDLMLILSFVWTGLLTGMLSLIRIEKLIKSKAGNIVGNWIVILILVASSFGVFCGRYFRWNSWDLFMDPQRIFLDLAYLVTDINEIYSCLWMTIILALFLLGVYRSIKLLSTTQ